MNDTKMDGEAMARAELEERQAKARAKLMTFRIDQGDHLEVMMHEQHGTHELVSYKASSTASAIMSSMSRGLKMQGYTGPLPSTMLVRANAIAKAAAKGMEALHQICAAMINEGGDEIDTTDCVLVHSMVQADMLFHYKRTLFESARTLVQNGTMTEEEAKAHIDMIMSGVIASVHAGTAIANEAIEVAAKMEKGEVDTKTDRSTGHVNVQMPIAKGESAETLKAASRAVLAHHLSGRGPGGGVGQA